MELLGPAYPRGGDEREERLSHLRKGALDALDEEFFSLIESEAGGFEKAADLFVEQFETEQPK